MSRDIRLINQHDVAVIKSVEFSDDVALLVRMDRLNETRFEGFGFLNQLLPATFDRCSVLFDLINLRHQVHVAIVFAVVAHFFEGLWIDIPENVS